MGQAPWITSSAVGMFFDALLARMANGAALDVRVVYRFKGADDLSISDLEALDRLAAAGVKVRYSNRLHAKIVVVDDNQAVVASSNLTATTAYSTNSGSWQNEELGVHLDGLPNFDLGVCFAAGVALQMGVQARFEEYTCALRHPTNPLPSLIAKWTSRRRPTTSERRRPTIRASRRRRSECGARHAAAARRCDLPTG